MNKKIIVLMMITLSGCAQLNDGFAKFKESAKAGYNNLNDSVSENQYKREFALNGARNLISDVKKFNKKNEDIENILNNKPPLFSGDSRGKVRGSYTKNNKISYSNAQNITWHISKLKKEIGEVIGGANLLKFQVEDALNRVDVSDDSTIGRMIINTPKDVDAFAEKYSDKNLEGTLNQIRARLSTEQKADWKLFQKLHKEIDTAYKSGKYQTVLDKQKLIGPNSTCKMQEQAYISNRELGKSKKFETRNEKEGFEMNMEGLITETINCYHMYLDDNAVQRVSKLGLKYGDLLTNEQANRYKRAIIKAKYGY